jgi:predicted TIM-barrel fold metal-dependent hydrolase
MIVDCFTHTWDNGAKLGRCVAPQRRPAAIAGSLDIERVGAGVKGHLAAAQPVDKTIVLGFKSRYLEANIPNSEVAAYVAHHPDRLIVFAGIDPSDPAAAIAEIGAAQVELKMAGLAIAPAAQDFHPSASHAMLVYAEAARRDLPIVFHTGVHVTSATKLEYAQPVLLDEVAREYPTLRLIVAHMGYPWVHETIALLAKHENVYAEISWLLHQPWQAYQALLSAHQYGVMDKLLFGSGFPASSASHCIEDLFGVNHMVHGTNLPTIPREQLRGIVHRNALRLLGIDNSAEPDSPSSAAIPAMIEDE